MIVFIMECISKECIVLVIFFLYFIEGGQYDSTHHGMQIGSLGPEELEANLVWVVLMVMMVKYWATDGKELRK